jgi:hypothetical protein
VTVVLQNAKVVLLNEVSQGPLRGSALLEIPLGDPPKESFGPLAESRFSIRLRRELSRTILHPAKTGFRMTIRLVC